MNDSSHDAQHERSASSSETEQPATKSTQQPQQNSLDEYSLFMQAPAYIALHEGADHVYVFSNPLHDQIIGHCSVLGKKLREVMPELEGQHVFERFDQVYRTGESAFSFALQATFCRSPESLPETGYFNQVLSPWHRADGTIRGVMSFAFDVTEAIQTQERLKAEIAEREQVEEALRESEQTAQSRSDEVEAIYATAPIGLCVLDTNLRYIRINNRLAEINGLSVEQHLGKTVREIVPDLADEAEPILHRIIQTGEPVHNIEIKGETLAQPGVERTWLENWLPFRNHQGQVIGISIVAEEVTERKQREAELQRYREKLALANQDLATANEELTAFNEELSETNNQLVRVNADLDNFVYTASHDLKAPISNIYGLLRILKQNLLPDSLAAPGTQKALRMIDQSIERFMNTIANLSDIARLQKQTHQPAKLVKLSNVIKEVRMDLALFIEQAEAQLDIAVDACGPIRFAPKNLRSVVYNLLSNAIKYRDPHRKPVIRVRCEAVEEYQVLTVVDNGLGIDLSQRNRLFSMFQRLHDHVEGTGIGLYIVKKLVEDAGGKIEVESEVGQGTTFRVFFKR